MVTSMADNISDRQPHGPVMLAGLGHFGCQVAHAVACSMESRGRDVTLFLVDGTTDGGLDGEEARARALHDLICEAGGVRMTFEVRRAVTAAFPVEDVQHDSPVGWDKHNKSMRSCRAPVEP